MKIGAGTASHRVCGLRLNPTGAWTSIGLEESRVSIAGPTVRLVLLLMAAGVAVTRADGRSTAAPIRIGVSLGLSGIYENIARHQERAYRLWEKRVNEGGGILGREVRVIIRDDQSDSEVAKRIYEDFVSKEKVEFLFGPYSSPITAAVAPLAEEHGFPMLVAGAAADGIWKHGYKNVVGIYAPAGRYAVGFLALMSEVGIERVAIVGVDDVFSLSVAEGARKWAPQYGLRLTTFIVVPMGKPELGRAAETARQSGAQALLLSGHFTEAVQMREALKRIGWSPAAYYATVGPAVPKYFDQLGIDANGTFFTSLWEPRDDLRYPGSAEFLHEFVVSYGEPPSYQAATAYAAGQILEQAIRKAGSADRALVRQALFSLDTNSIMGRYSVDRTGAQSKGLPLIVQWQGKRREIVWPPQMRTAAPVVRR